MKNILNITLLFFILLGLWLLLTLPVSMQEIVAGSIAVFVILLLFRKTFIPLLNFKFTPKSFLYAFPLSAVFILELIKANIDVALRVIQPRLPINPGIVKVRTKLSSPFGRLLLANAITLTPGTLTVETEDDTFYLHWIDVSAEDIEATTNKIVNKFERYLEVMFG